MIKILIKIGGYEGNEMNGAGYNNEPSNNQYPPPADLPPIPNSYENSESNGYENNNNIPNNNYGPSNHAPAGDYYDEGQPNEYSVAASTNSKIEKSPKEKKK